LPELKIKTYQINTGDHVVCYIDPITNKRKRKKFSSKAEAKNYRNDLQSKYQAKGPQTLNQTPLGQYLKLHLEVSPNSRMMDRKVHFESFRKEFESRPINQVGKAELHHWLQKIQTDHDLSDRTMNTIKSDINTFFRYLEDEQIIQNSPLTKIKFERKPPARRQRVVLSIDEIHKVLEGAKVFSPRLLYPLLFIAAYTGSRRGEVQKLKRKDVDFETGLIHFRQTKNGEDRTIRMSPSLKKFLEEHLTTHESEYVVTYKNNDNVPGYIIGKHLRRFRKLFPIGKDWGPHALRHSFAFNFLKKGGNMYQLQAILGHKSIDVTVDIYGQIGAQDVENSCPYEETEKV
jgi:integrase